MATSPTIGVHGLWRSTSILGGPPGALKEADGCVIRSKGLLEPRRGQDLVQPATRPTPDDGLVDAVHVAVAGAFFNQRTTGTSPSVSKLWKADLATPAYTGLGSHTAPDLATMRMRFAEMLGREYFTSTLGPQMVDGSTVVRAGVARPDLQWSDSFATYDVGGFLSTDSAVAYVATIARVDSAGRETQSAPSSRLVITNPVAAVVAIGALVRAGTTVTATCNAAHGLKPGDTTTLSPGEANFAAGDKVVVAVTAYNVFTYTEAGAAVASGAQQTFTIGAAKCSVYVNFEFVAPAVGWVLRLWRTENAASASSVPGEDYYQVYEKTLAAADVAAGYLAISDNTPEAVMGSIGYFSASADSFLRAKDIPPYCKVLAPIGDSGNRMAYANTRERHRVVVQLLATGGTSGLQLGDVVLVTRNGTGGGGTAVNTAPGVNEFTIFDGGTPQMDVEKTALALVDCINKDAGYGLTNPIRARYISGPDDPAGRMEFEAADDRDLPIYIACTTPGCFQPVTETTAIPPPEAVPSTLITHPNRVYISEPREPEAVPSLQYVDIGESGDAILFIGNLIDATVVLKERSAWVMSGEWPSIRVQRIDAELSVVGADTCAVLGGQVYALTSQGVVSVSPGGVGLIGSPISDDLGHLLASTTLRTMAWGCAYPSDSLYLLGIPEAGDPDTATCVYAYSVMGKSWTRWPMARACAAVNPTTGRLVLGDGGRALLRHERKALTRDDLVDEKWLDASGADTLFSVASVDSVAGTLTLTDSSAVELIEVGDGIEQVNSRGVVTAISGRTLTLTDVAGFTAGAPDGPGCSVYRAIETLAEWIPDAGGDPSTAKQCQEVVLHFQRFAGHVAETRVASEMAPGAVRVHQFECDGWGESGYGARPWGDPDGPRNERAHFGRDASRGAYPVTSFRMRCAWGYWRLMGRSIELEVAQERGRR